VHRNRAPRRPKAKSHRHRNCEIALKSDEMISLGVAEPTEVGRVRSLKSVGPNATLVEGDIEAVIHGLKARLVGEIQVGGPDLARSLTDLGLIDEYRLYLHPVVLGRGKP
jgi:riboflavin biosynthesis pyrimidine reductase